eukprot:CCRYP_008950-RA/>CCRYP_008950-RA protein AED:0.66 eAED:0.66 QI:0/-1/0/1/-1/0/1/0/136
MASVQKPTTRTRHMDIRFFALSEWVEWDLMLLEHINTAINMADHMTKILNRTLFYRHVDYIMGHIPPIYSPCYTAFSNQPIPCILPDHTIDDMTLNTVAAAAVAKCSLTGYPWPLICFCSAHSNPTTTGPWIVGGC